MTNIEKIKQARALVDYMFNLLSVIAESGSRIRPIDIEGLQKAFADFSYAQAEAIRQATEVADENFARAQKLSEQVQENVRHIELLADRRSDEDARIAECLAHVDKALHSAVRIGIPVGIKTISDLASKTTYALALAKGEAV